MKLRHLLATLAVSALLWAVILSPVIALGAEPAAGPSAVGVQLSAAPQLPPTAVLIAVLVPLVIALAKKLFPALPAGALPVIAPVLGGLLELALARYGLDGGGPLTGVLAGGAGVGLREIVDQTKKNVGGPLPPGPLLCAGLALGLLPGCASFGNRQEDRSIVIHPDGSREERNITSRQKSGTFFDSKSALANLRASQTDKSQSIGLGTLSQESSGSNAVQVLRIVVEGAASVAK